MVTYKKSYSIRPFFISDASEENSVKFCMGRTGEKPLWKIINKNSNSMWKVHLQNLISDLPKIPLPHPKPVSELIRQLEQK